MGTLTGQKVAGGLELRAATAADIEDIVVLQTAAFGHEDESNVRTYLTGPGASIDDWTVVTDDGVIVSACALLDVPVRLDGLPVPGGQVEYVATNPAYQRRGLIRAQFDAQHERSAARGHVVQFVGGIPYVYRRFGYGYGVSHPEMYVITHEPFAAVAVHDPDVRVRPATEADIPALMRLEAQRPTTGLTSARDEHFWQFELAIATPRRTATGTTDPSEHPIIVERDGEVVAWASLATEEHRVWLHPTRTPDRAVVDAIIGHGLELAGEARELIGLDQPGTDLGDRVREIGTLLPYGQGVYVRIADPVAFLAAIRPVLDARLQASRFAAESGEVTISLYDSAVRLAHADGRITDVEPAARIEDPWEDGECGVAPDWFPALVLGRWGAIGLAARIDDVFLGAQAELLEVLFPQIPTDIVGDF